MAFTFKPQFFIQSPPCPVCGGRGYSILNKKGVYIICTSCYSKTPTATLEGAQSADKTIQQDRISVKDAQKLAFIAWRSGTLQEPVRIVKKENLIKYPDGTAAVGFLHDV